MAPQTSLIDKVLADAAFCVELVARPDETLGALGVDAAPEVLCEIRALDPARLQRLAGAFGRQPVAA
ncbi:hypothetical protein [Piscinibacter sakaiensis]|uniref:Uncharacterized protein n=1 Tax=Piscinibacter sakaiensis TaxID=1547922 RepID=A0A0K8P4Y8_PISS1|nr:hypothetical protein [Piscinibacter sakaiensis]GAP37225.1 hypothetical protein ISF6_3080 [Piscinibacter sakaiensis]